MSVQPKHMTASGIVVEGAGTLHGVLVTTDGVNPVDVALYDGTDTSGGNAKKVLPAFTVPATVRMDGLAPSEETAIPFTTGLYLDLDPNGGDTEVVVYVRR